MMMNQAHTQLFYQEKSEKGMVIYWLQLDSPTAEREFVTLQDGEFIGLVCIDSETLFVLYNVMNDSYLNRYYIPQKQRNTTQISSNRPLSEQFRGDYITCSFDMRFVGVSFYLRKEKKMQNVIKIYNYDSIEELAATRLTIDHPEGKIKKFIFAKQNPKNLAGMVTDILVAVTEGNYGLYVFMLKTENRKMTLSKIEFIEELHKSKLCLY